MWKHLNQLIGRGSKSTHIPSFKVCCETLLDENYIAETFNNYTSEMLDPISQTRVHKRIVI